MPDFHCSPSANITSGLSISGMDGNSGNSFRILRYYSANITSGLPISGMDGNSGNSFRILRYLFLDVIILFHWIFARVLLTYVFDISCTGHCCLSVVGMAIFHVLNLFLRSHGHM